MSAGVTVRRVGACEANQRALNAGETGQREAGWGSNVMKKGKG